MKLVAHLTCPLCEAMCGLSTTTSDGSVSVVRGDREHPLSGGYICPKGASLPALHADPDRLRRPLVREGGTLVETSWDNAFARTDELVASYLQRHGRDTLATYIGNPSVHNLSLILYGSVLARAIGSRNAYSSASVDALPMLTVHALLLGDAYALPVPDVERTSLMLVFGANPVVSNGSLMSAPDFKRRVRALHERGGRLVVIDPRRSETAAIADEHLFIRPATDVWLLAAMLHHVIASGRADAAFLERHVNGFERLAELVAPFTFELAEARCGVTAATARRLADEFASVDAAVAYGRMGTSTQRYGAVCSWLIACLNIVTGKLDRPGGSMFPLSAVQSQPPREPQSGARGRWSSRVRGLDESFGELPAITMAEDILEPGPGRIRGLVTIAGNPAVSVPDGGAMRRALPELELFVCVDSYLNETTRHADVVLPGESPLERPHFPLLTRFAVRNVAQWSDPVLPPEADRPREWQVLLRLARSFGADAPADLDAFDDELFTARVAREVRDPRSPIHGWDVATITAWYDDVRGPERIMDLRLRLGPYGDRYLGGDGLSVASLRNAPHGVDLGPLESRLLDVLATTSGRIELHHESLERELRDALSAQPQDGPLLVSRRSLRSNNSWMHNIPQLISGRSRCTLEMHPDDARLIGADDGDVVTVRASDGCVEAPLEITHSVMPGVVCLPHGWGHDEPGTRLNIAATRPGVNSNLLGDPGLLDGVTATAVTNGIPVSIEARSSRRPGP